jgi:hydrogenase maturation protease
MIEDKKDISLGEIKADPHDILVLGVGNYLMGDEGVGVHVAQKMEKMDLPFYVDVVDGGTGGFFLMGYFDMYEKVIFVDATMDGKPPGTISQIKPKFASDFPQALSVHDVGLKDMIETLYLMEHIPEMHLFTISIGEITPMYVGLSPSAQAAVDQIVPKIIKLAEQLHQ